MEPPTTREAIKQLENDGFEEVKRKSPHRRYKKGNRLVTVPGNLNDHLTWKTWESIKKQAGW